MRILIIEDEKKVAQALKSGLEMEGFEALRVSTGEEGFFLLNSEKIDLLILDLMLPGRDGLEILDTLRKQNAGLPVLILTAKDTVEDRVTGLNAGADDYLVKPFAFPELLARVRALLRRGKPEPDLVLKASDLVMDVLKRQVGRDGKEISLTAREFDLLEYLLRNKGRVVSREMLARDVWKEPHRATTLDNVIDVHVARLRRKIDDRHDGKILVTVRGVGFMIEG